MDDIFVYIVDLPTKIHEMVMPCEDGYTIYISNMLDHKNQLKALMHAVSHIRNNDFASCEDVQTLENNRHVVPKN